MNTGKLTMVSPFTMKHAGGGAFMHYQTALENWPPSGTGQRLVQRHIARLARLSRLAGIPAEQGAKEIDSAMRRHTRPPFAGEIADALRFVGGGEIDETIGGGHPKVVHPAALDTFRSYAEVGVAMGFSEVDLRTPSPVRMPGSDGALRISWAPGWRDAIVFLLALFEPDDWVLCLPSTEVRAGEADVQRRDDWCAEMERRSREGIALPTFVLPNPTKEPGNWALNTSGCPSPRVKGSVASYRNLVLDRDKNPLHNRHLAAASQIAFWGGWGKRFGWESVRAVVHTGNKSLHTILAVHAKTEADWDAQVVHGILSEFARLGFDGSFSNPAQMCRLPGAWRRLEDHQLEASDREADGTVPESNRWQQQRLLFVQGVRR